MFLQYQIILQVYVATFFIRLEKIKQKTNYIKLVKRGGSTNYFSAWKLQTECHAELK